METKVIFARCNIWIEKLVVCKECKHVAKDQERHKQHVKEARHINTLRSLAYRLCNFLLMGDLTCLR